MDALAPADYEAIRQLEGRYCFAVDSGDLDTVIACYLEDGAFECVDATAPDHPLCGRFQGHAVLRDYYQTLYSDYQRGLYRHFMAAMSVFGEADGDVTVSSYMLVLNVGLPGAERVVGSASYHDRVRQTSEGWKFAERRWVADTGPPPRP
ncbi:MAG TPA: nuclear transport factor 2 family protein [Solirubrobacteraceae bacterium]|jgi:3-phenylpropionate/cinnamic acid dioxygenase small subunit